MLSSKTSKYAYSGLPPPADDRGVYFPDGVVDAFVGRDIPPPPVAGGSARSQAFNAVSGNGPAISFEQSRDLVLAALRDFDPALGKRAETIFNAGYDDAAAAARRPGFSADWDRLDILPNGSRWRLEQVPPGRLGVMRSLPAGAAQTEYDPANPNPQAVIDYQFDGTIDSAIWMAHEVGHAIADDCRRERAALTGDARQSPRHMNETQAYFVQHVFYDYVRRHPELDKAHPGIVAATENHFRNYMDENVDDARRYISEGNMQKLHDVPLSLFSARVLFEGARDQEDSRTFITDSVMGRHGPQNISAVMAAAGIETPADLRDSVRRMSQEFAAQNPVVSPARRPTHNKVF